MGRSGGLGGGARKSPARGRSGKRAQTPARPPGAGRPHVVQRRLEKLFPRFPIYTGTLHRAEWRDFFFFSQLSYFTKLQPILL